MSGQAVGGKEFELLFEKQFSLLLIASQCSLQSEEPNCGSWTTTTSSAFSCDSQLSGNGDADKLPLRQLRSKACVEG
ncbi:MAG: hypothetical protein EOS78_14755 [Mesorhizobium sp.]|uniref:hypothetical protein n=1 Tax=unclassified Mesorhizobium TaxID=325217 RepID=UPI000F75D41B|nr:MULTISPECIES: hypothetical protein [unclassified Mesorhizobium]AZO55727.1 hypothetical protein EJ077_21615 [Mesorhizobium sp. M8A.F.Ca.ET.057.01.1.1]RWE38005.1 MAG: hypothetical protein EOS78_14755 [Mesorhizobium sp.]RWE40691.1 MAG: hypothetical protein EOS80_30115 [Mesorhizobium sp.]TJX73628.1 MAG: hypothetical protein E5W21_05770 [Mesorhizobium sp.]